MKNKKIISLVSAMAMTVSCFSSLVIAQAATNVFEYTGDSMDGWAVDSKLGGNPTIETDELGSYLKFENGGNGSKIYTYTLPEAAKLQGKYTIEMDALTHRGNGKGRLGQNEQIAFIGSSSTNDQRDYGQLATDLIAAGATINWNTSTQTGANYFTDAALKIDARPDLNNWILNDYSDTLALEPTAAAVADDQWARIQATIDGTTAKITVIDSQNNKIVDGQSYTCDISTLNQIVLTANRGDDARGTGFVCVDNIKIYAGEGEALTTTGLRGAMVPPTTVPSTPTPTPTETPAPVAAPAVTAPTGATVVLDQNFNALEAKRLMILGTEGQENTDIDGLSIKMGARSDGGSDTTYVSVVNNGENDNVLNMAANKYSTAGRGPVVTLTKNVELASMAADAKAAMSFALKLVPNGTEPASLFFLGSTQQMGDKGDGAYRHVAAKLTTADVAEGSATEAHVDANKWVVVTFEANNTGAYTVYVDGNSVASGQQMSEGDNRLTLTSLPMIALTSAKGDAAVPNSLISMDNLVVYSTDSSVVVPTPTIPVVVPTPTPTTPVVVPTTEPTAVPTAKPTAKPIPSDPAKVEGNPGIAATTVINDDGTVTVSMKYTDVPTGYKVTGVQFELPVDETVFEVVKKGSGMGYKNGVLKYVKAATDEDSYMPEGEYALVDFTLKIKNPVDYTENYYLEFGVANIELIDVENNTKQYTLKAEDASRVNTVKPAFTVEPSTEPTAKPTATPKPTPRPVPSDPPVVEGNPFITATAVLNEDGTITVSMKYAGVPTGYKVTGVQFELPVDETIFEVVKKGSGMGYKNGVLKYVKAATDEDSYMPEGELALTEFTLKIKNPVDYTENYYLEFSVANIELIDAENNTKQYTLTAEDASRVNTVKPVVQVVVVEPTVVPTVVPTTKPTATPTVKPTATPTQRPTATPTRKPSGGSSGSSGGSSGQIAPGNPTANPSGTSFTGTVKGGGNAIGTMTGSNTFTVIVRVNGQMQSQFTGFDPVVVRAPYSLGAANLANLVVVDQNGNVVPRSRYSNGYMVTALKNTSGTFTIKEITKSFGDVNHPWAQEAIGALAAREIINGVGENLFDPDASVTREQFAKMVVTMFDVLDSSAPLNFSDVDASGWSAAYIATAQKLGIVTGYEDNTFRPNQTITREEMSTILYRAAKNLGVNITPVKEGVTFTDDASIQSWAKEAVSEMQKAGILQGVGDNMFDPANNASRAQAAVAIYNMFVASLS
jgi:hypothetical protein